MPPKQAVYDYFHKDIFLCEMIDYEKDEIRTVTLNYFPFDNSVQVIDPVKGKNLVKRTQMPGLKPEMFIIGNIINVFAKLLHITDCAPKTKKNFLQNEESTFALIKPVSPSLHGKVLNYIIRKGFRINQIKNRKIDKDLALEMYQDVASSGMLPLIIDYVTSGDVIGLELVAPDAIKYWRYCLGSTDPKTARPGCLRAMFGENALQNVAHGVSSRREADNMIKQFFGTPDGMYKVVFSATFENCTLCLIKPHAIIEGHVGEILEHISTSGKFYVSAMAMFSIKLINALEFFEVYKGILPSYEAMAIHLSEGKCLALELKSVDPNIEVVSEFRKLAGPRDPEVCRQLYPDTLRARFGVDIVHNAVHCTDLPEDGVLEVEYFFKILPDADKP